MAADLVHKEDEIKQEGEAVARLHACLETIGADLQWYWSWGDGEGGYLLKRLAQIVRASGYRWPDDPRLGHNKRDKKKIPRNLYRAVMERDEYRCITCGTHLELTCDHIIPESKGGETSFENLQAMCMPCNGRKGTKVLAA